MQADMSSPAENDSKEKPAADDMLPDALCWALKGPLVGAAELSAKPPPAGFALRHIILAATQRRQLIALSIMKAPL